MLNPKTAVKLAPAALAVVAALGSPLSAFAAPVVTLGADNAIESSEGTATANVPVTLTADGTWRDKADGEHDMGKYVVTVPTSISVKGISAGSNDIRVPYKVNVAGIIGSGKKVTATAQTDRHQAPYMLSVTQGKTEFTAKEISNGTNDSKGALHINGSDSTDTLSTQQDVWYSDSVTGNVTYNFAIA